MSEEIAISVQGVSKAYRIWESPAGRLTSPILQKAAGLFSAGSLLAQSLQNRAARNYRDFWALKDISFDVKKGEIVGIIGRNGSGKSTLLQIITGTLQPTVGSVKVNGRVAALLELGSGFNPEFTGRENVYLNATVLGLSRGEIDAKFQSITDFADIGDFIEQPVKTYSSGMLMRLACAVQTAVDPEILIVDEALSVGDVFFQQKCAQRMSELQRQGTTMLLVSHDMAVIRHMCNRALYLKKGECIALGTTTEVMQFYHNEAAGTGPPVDSSHHTPVIPNATEGALDALRRDALWQNATPSTELPAQVTILAVRNRSNEPTTTALLGETLTVEFSVLAQQTEQIDVSLLLKNRYDQIVCCLNAYCANLTPISMRAGSIIIVRITFNVFLEAGTYTLQAVVGRCSALPNRAVILNTTPWLGPLTFKWDYETTKAPFLAMFGLPSQMSLISILPAIPGD